MAGESQQTPRTEPDPTVFTTEQLMRMLKAERDFTEAKNDIIRQRLDSMDEATKVLHETVTRVPTETQKAVGHLHQLVDEKFSSTASERSSLANLQDEKFRSVQVQFAERDERALRESRDNKVAVDAAFAAQKEAAAEQNKSNTLAIDKSEKATNESINKLGEAAIQANKSLSDKIEDVKSLVTAVTLQVNGIRSEKSGGQEQRHEGRQNMSAIYAAVGFVIMLLMTGITILAFRSGGGTP